MDTRLRILIINPTADNGKARDAIAQLRSGIKNLGVVDWEETKYQKHAIELTRESAEAGYEVVIACGGDGTVHEVVNGLMRTPRDIRPRLGVVPLGSGNDFAHAVGVDPDPLVAIQRATNGQPHAIDVGRLIIDNGDLEGVSELFFDNTVGIGFDASVTIRSRRIKNISGFLMYFTAVLQTILMNHHSPRMSFKTDREEWIDEFLMFVVCNGPREGGGFIVAPDAKPEDGIFHYAGVTKVSRLMMLRLVPEVMKGTHGKFNQVRMGELKNLRLEANQPLFVHTDGEIVTGFDSDVRRLAVELLPAEIFVMR